MVELRERPSGKIALPQLRWGEVPSEAKAGWGELPGPRFPGRPGPGTVGGELGGGLAASGVDGEAAARLVPVV